MEPVFIKHPAFAVWPPIYTPSEQDTEYSGDSPMQGHQELPEEDEHSSSLSHPFPPRSQSVLSSNVSINDSGIFLSEPDEPAPSNTRKTRAPRISVSQRYADVLGILRQGGLSPIKLMTAIANVAAPEYEMYRVKMYENGANLRDFLDAVMQDDNGRRVMMEWMRPHAMAQVCASVQSEMCELDKEFRSDVTSITPVYIQDWTMEKDVITPVEKITPPLLQVICAAVTSRQTEKNGNKLEDTTRVRVISGLRIV